MEYNKLSIFYLASTEKECFRLPFELSFEQFSITSRCSGKCSLHGRCLKGNLGKGGQGSGREENARGARGGREGNASQETIVFTIPPTNYVCKNNATVND